MNKELQSRCELFIENKNKLDKVAAFDMPSVCMVASNLITAANVPVDQDKVKECRKLLKSKTGALSDFRGNITMPLVSMLALSDDPEAKMDRAFALDKKLRKELFASEFMALTAMALTDMVDESEEDKYISRGKGLYKRMRKDHPFLTGAEDGVLAVLLSFSNKSDDQLIDDMEQICNMLKDDKFKSSSALGISRIFAMADGDHSVKCAKLRKIIDALAAGGRKYGKGHELAVLAGLVTLDVPAEILAEEILEADAFLSAQKGYGIMGFDKQSRLMQAAMIVADHYTDGNANKGAELSTITGTITMVVAMQVAVIVGASAGASAAASSAATSGGH